MEQIKKIKEALEDRRLDKVSEATGVAYNTVRQIKNDPHANPTKATIERLASYLGVA